MQWRRTLRAQLQGSDQRIGTRPHTQSGHPHARHDGVPIADGTKRRRRRAGRRRARRRSPIRRETRRRRELDRFRRRAHNGLRSNPWAGFLDGQTDIQTTSASPDSFYNADDIPMFPSTDVLLQDLEKRILTSFPHSLQQLAALPQKVVFRTPSRRSREFPTIKLQVAYDPIHVYDIEALLDSGATATYISPSFIEDHRIPTRKLPYATYAYNADDTLNATAITHQAKLTCSYRGHVSTEWFFVTDIGSKTMIIGMTWLRSHNPEINWYTGEMKFSRCPASCIGQRSLKDVLDTMIDAA